MNGGGQIYEIQPANEPTINVSKCYPKLTEYRVECGYDLVKITYATTSVQRLYKINDGEWKTYTGGNIRLETGETIYAKGIDKNGEETRVITSYTSTLPSDALGAAAYDGNNSTYVNTRSAGSMYMEIDESMKGRRVYVNISCSYIYSKRRWNNGNARR